MKLNFKVMAESFAVIGLAGTLTVAVAMDNNSKVPTETEVAVNTTEASEEPAEVTVQEQVVDVVASSVEEIEVQIEEVVTEPELTAEELEWQNSLMANVKDSLNVRAEASEDAEVVGVLYRGSKATVVENGAEWTKITSGNVEGYVKNDYCLYGTEALNFAKEVCGTYATANTDGLRVREEMNTESDIADVLEQGEKIKVNTDVVTDSEWVAVISNSDTCYVSAEYVTVAINTTTGITSEELAEIRRQEEEAKRKAAEEAARKAEEAKKAEEKKQSSNKKPSTTKNEAVSANVDEVTLLAAIIQCEAGGGSNDGQVAVGAVVMNRVRSSRFPNTIEGVIYQSGQFTPVKSGKLASRLANGVKSSCVQAAKEALSGVDNTGGALFFRSKASAAASGKTGTLIGGNVFY
ncbi:MAG: cell wall hydrolase [Lachnospiraceae bacterium]|nr:cell wall hydrolase [Lachnospiraceae bacterium]